MPKNDTPDRPPEPAERLLGRGDCQIVGNEKHGFNLWHMGPPIEFEGRVFGTFGRGYIGRFTALWDLISYVEMEFPYAYLYFDGCIVGYPTEEPHVEPQAVAVPVRQPERRNNE